MAPPALAHRAVRAWLCTAGGDEAHPPDAATVARVLAVARGDAKGCDAGRGWQVRRSAGVLRLVPPGADQGVTAAPAPDSRPSAVR